MPPPRHITAAAINIRALRTTCDRQPYIPVSRDKPWPALNALNTPQADICILYFWARTCLHQGSARWVCILPLLMLANSNLLSSLLAQ